jgi:type VI secretion system secreted protein VgrG
MSLGDNISEVRYTFQADGVTELWRVHALHIEESLSKPYRAELSLVSEEPGAAPSDLLGRSCRLTISRADSERRVSGLVLEVGDAEVVGEHVLAKVTLGPALAVLAQRSGSRMFQHVTVPEIVAKVLADGLTPYQRAARQKLDRDYPKREYCLQYGESDLAFVSRLLAEEGIFFFFDQSGEREVMVLLDRNQDCPSFSGDEDAVALVGTGSALADTEALRRFSWREKLRPNAVTLRDFDWTRPALDLTRAVKPAEQNSPLRELYDYAPPLTLHRYDEGTGRYQADDGRDRARLRLEAEAVRERIGTGSGFVTRFAVGTTFVLVGHSSERDRRYLITSVTHEGHAPEEIFDRGSVNVPRAQSAPGNANGAAAGDGGERQRYENTFSCIPVEVPFRAPPAPAPPRIPGLQSALVVGPPGEEIHTDQHGRIRVRFPWDREARGDETSSCWVRVAQVWSGPGWGFVFVPRIGMEVLVAFMAGDPDQPLVVGCAYDGQNPAPYELPANKTRSTIKTSSTPGGNGFNEVRFEDLAGKEELFIHAQKDMNIVVLNNRTTNIGVDETTQIGHDRRLTVLNDETVLIAKNQDQTIGVNETRRVGANFSETIGANKAETVVIACAETIGAAKALTVGAAYQVFVGAAMNETIVGVKAEEIGGAKTVKVGASSLEDIVANKSVKAGQDFVVNAGANGLIEIAKQLTLKCGDAIITLNSNGDISIKGAKINIKGSSDVVVKGAKIGEN